MEEKYYSLKMGNPEDQLGAVLRERKGNLEELTGFIHITRVRKVRKKGVKGDITYYRANVNTDCNGNPLGNEDFIGLMISDAEHFNRLEIYRHPKKGRGIVLRIPKSKANEILENIHALRLTEGYICDDDY